MKFIGVHKVKSAFMAAQVFMKRDCFGNLRVEIGATAP